MTVPEGYFENFAREMEQKLPRQPWEDEAQGTPVVMPRTMWQKIRPYVYMAAMFAGIWCMMKGFDMMRSHTSAASPFETNAHLASAITNDSFMGDYITSTASETDFYDELFEEGFDPTTL